MEPSPYAMHIILAWLPSSTIALSLENSIIGEPVARARHRPVRYDKRKYG